jgi:hypothetical protein
MGQNREDKNMTKKIRLLAACTVAGCFASLAIASAQSTTSPDPSSESASPSPASPNSAFAKQPGSLSDKLDASNGVIHPKEVDPAIEKKPPPTGTAAVIAPPGSPGGPQGVQPK